MWHLDFESSWYDAVHLETTSLISNWSKCYKLGIQMLSEHLQLGPCCTGLPYLESRCAHATTDRTGKRYDHSLEAAWASLCPDWSLSCMFDKMARSDQVDFRIWSVPAINCGYILKHTICQKYCRLHCYCTFGYFKSFLTKLRGCFWTPRTFSTTPFDIY